MNLRPSVLAAAMFASTLTSSTALCAQPDLSGKGSLLVFPNVEIKWDANGNLIQDTLLSLNNDHPLDVDVFIFMVNGDPELEQLCSEEPCTPNNIIREFEPGCNRLNCRLPLTGDQPVLWSAANGGSCPTFTDLDPDGPGRPDPESAVGDRVLRGFVVAWAVGFDETFGANGAFVEQHWNHLFAVARQINYRNATVSSYDAYAFKALAGVHGDFLPDPGVLNLDGVEFEAAFSELQLDFFSSGSVALSSQDHLLMLDTDLTLLPMNIDLRQDNVGPTATNAVFDIWNQSEDQFSGTRKCISCWDQTLLSQYPIPNMFVRPNLGSDKGHARIGASPSALCESSQSAPLLGVVSKLVTAAPGGGVEESSRVLVGAGERSGSIRYDLELGAGPRSPNPTDDQDAGTNTTAGEIPDRVKLNRKGSLLLYPDVQLRWSADGTELLEDTFIELTNTFPEDVHLRIQAVNGDEPLPNAEPGWNTKCCTITLTQDQPVYWSAATGLPDGCAFTELDPDGPGRPDPETAMATRVLRGFLLIWAVDENGDEISWNFLTGSATHVGYSDGFMWEDRPYAFQAVSAPRGEPTNSVPRELLLDGVEFDQPHNDLIMSFLAAGSTVLSHGGVVVQSDGRLVLFPMDMDFRSVGEPVTTKADARITNEFESTFSGTRRCITCWLSSLLSEFALLPSIPNHFRRTALHTDAGKAVIEGNASAECDPPGTAASLGGVSVDTHLFSGPTTFKAAAGVTLSGGGFGTGRILVDRCDCNTDEDCDDGVFCSYDLCIAGGCVAVSACPPKINGCVEGNAICDEANDTCIDVPHDEWCTNPNVCDGTETCDLSTGDCLPGTPLNCNDGLFCNGVERCDPTVGCRPGVAPPCGRRGCDEANDRCRGPGGGSTRLPGRAKGPE